MTRATPSKPQSSPRNDADGTKVPPTPKTAPMTSPLGATSREPRSLMPCLCRLTSAFSRRRRRSAATRCYAALDCVLHWSPIACLRPVAIIPQTRMPVLESKGYWKGWIGSYEWCIGRVADYFFQQLNAFGLPQGSWSMTICLTAIRRRSPKTAISPRASPPIANDRARVRGVLDFDAE